MSNMDELNSDKTINNTQRISEKCTKGVGVTTSNLKKKNLLANTDNMNSTHINHLRPLLENSSRNFSSSPRSTPRDENVPEMEVSSNRSATMEVFEKAAPNSKQYGSSSAPNNGETPSAILSNENQYGVDLRRVVNELKQRYRNSESREIEARNEALFLQLENEKLRVLLDWKERQVESLRKEFANIQSTVQDKIIALSKIDVDLTERDSGLSQRVESNCSTSAAPPSPPPPPPRAPASGDHSDQPPPERVRSLSGILHMSDHAFIDLLTSTTKNLPREFL